MPFSLTFTNIVKILWKYSACTFLFLVFLFLVFIFLVFMFSCVLFMAYLTDSVVRPFIYCYVNQSSVCICGSRNFLSDRHVCVCSGSEKLFSGACTLPVFPEHEGVWSYFEQSGIHADSNVVS